MWKGEKEREDMGKIKKYFIQFEQTLRAAGSGVFLWWRGRGTSWKDLIKTIKLNYLQWWPAEAKFASYSVAPAAVLGCWCW